MTELYHLLLPTTTGFNRPKKSKPFESFDEALQAGYALNLLEGKKDRIFVILKESDIKSYTQLTGEIPFSQSFFRFNRLSDSSTKFQTSLQKESMEVNLDTSALPDRYEKFLINPSHPAALLSEENKTKPLKDRLLENGLSKENIHHLQNLIQSELKYTILDHQPSPVEQNLKLILEDKFNSLEKANKYIYNVIWASMDFDSVDETTGERKEGLNE